MQVLNVSGMGCGSCVAQIMRAVQQLDDDAVVRVDRANGTVAVESAAGVEEICEAITALGYPAAPAR